MNVVSPLETLIGIFFTAMFVIVPLLGLALLIFWLWMLIDCLRNEPSDGNDKIVWVLVIIFTNWIGALIYYFVRRPERPDRKRGGALAGRAGT